MLNGETASNLAAAFAERLRSEAGNDVSTQIQRAYHLAAGRDPSDSEQRIARDFLSSQPLEEFALAIFNLNSFLYVD